MKMTFFGWLLTTVSVTASAFVWNWCVCVCFKSQYWQLQGTVNCSRQSVNKYFCSWHKNRLLCPAAVTVTVTASRLV